MGYPPQGYPPKDYILNRLLAGSGQSAGGIRGIGAGTGSVTIDALTTYDLRPPLGEEWMITSLHFPELPVVYRDYVNNVQETVPITFAYGRLDTALLLTNQFGIRLGTYTSPRAARYNYIKLPVGSIYATTTTIAADTAIVIDAGEGNAVLFKHASTRGDGANNGTIQVYIDTYTHATNALLSAGTGNVSWWGDWIGRRIRILNESAGEIRTFVTGLRAA